MNYVTDIGLEVHIELNTRSKLFCSCSTAFGAAPNTLCCPVCSGLPGALPTVNKHAVQLAVRAGLALGCEIAEFTAFDRKNYMYPDLPRAYQISQLYFPICRGGRLDIEIGGKKKTVRITEMHLEDDAGKTTELPDGRIGIDYNRCGVPLLELVTEPCMHSGEEAAAFLTELIGVLRYCGISDCRIQEGSIRADMNLSVRTEDSEKMGVRTETKNIGSLRELRRAADFESARQIGVLECGGTVECETRRWDESRGKTVYMRPKESQSEYRYFPEPDIPPIHVDADMTKEQLGFIPELPASKRRRYGEIGINSGDCATLTDKRYTAEFFEKCIELGAKPTDASAFICTDAMALANDSGTSFENSALTPELLTELIKLTTDGKISRATGKEVLKKLYFEAFEPGKYVEEQGLMMITDTAETDKAVLEVLSKFQAQVAEYKSGKVKVKGFLMGKVMAELKGRGDPALITQALNRALEN